MTMVGLTERLKRCPLISGFRIDKLCGVSMYISLKKIPNDNMDFKKYTPHITTHNQTFVYDFAYI